MKKTISIFLIITLIFSLTYSYVVYAGDEESFFEISSEEISKTESLEMTINLDLIEYDSFIFKLTSDYSLENIEVSEDGSTSDTEIELSTENDETEESAENQIQMEITKSDNIEKIILIYTLPEDAEVGDVITFEATITNVENEEEIESVQVEVTVVEESTSTDEEDDTSSNNTNSNSSTNENNSQRENNEQSTDNMQDLGNSQSTSNSQDMQMSMNTDTSSRINE